jgi:hypothetical protein
MKTRILAIFAVVAMVVAFAYAVSVPAAANPASPNPAPAAANAAPMPADHPEIRDALASLHHAKDHLEHAAHDFGGHRVDAIHATDEAIRQLEICLKFDK